jgi:hypothetical protein
MAAVVDTLRQPDVLSFAVLEATLFLVIVIAAAMQIRSATSGKTRNAMKWVSAVVRDWGKKLRSPLHAITRFLRQRLGSKKQGKAIRKPRIVEASADISASTEVRADGAVVRDQESWGKFYLLHGLILLLLFHVIGVMDFANGYKAPIGIGNFLAVTYLTLLNGWFRNKVVGWFSKLERKPEK